jgi:phosphoesterase RecJ-like protein
MISFPRPGLTQIDYELALPLYAAIITDTGFFRYERMTPKLHLIAAELLKAGIVPHEVTDKIYDQSRLSKIKLLGYSLSTMQISDTGNVAYMIITRELLDRSGALESEVDGFVNYCLAIQGVKVGILFFELKDGIKVSFRSKGIIPINKLAAEFEGGGHTNAAATRLFNTTLDQNLTKIIDRAEDYIKNFS